MSMPTETQDLLIYVFATLALAYLGWRIAGKLRGKSPCGEGCRCPKADVRRHPLGKALLRARAGKK